MRPRVPAPRRGYTLAEVLIVITIIGILSTFALPKLSDLRDKSALYTARARFVRAVMSARQAAIQRGKKAYFRTNNNTMWVFVDTTGSNTDSVVVMRPLNMSSQYGITITAPTGLTSIVYDPRGVATQASKTVFVFRHTSSHKVDSLCVSKLGNTIRDRCPT
jgi:prepilin-type N-terminal cleavage/methylation domain-containing protein